MKLTKVLSDLPYKIVQGETEIDIRNITNDSRLAEEGSLFIAISGYHVDGHDFIRQVAEKGCRCVIVQRPMEDLKITHPNVCVILVENTLEAMAKISSNFYGKPSESFNLIGVTGTNGKTSIAQLIGGCLESVGKKTAVLGTTGNRIGERMYPTSNTTVESIKLQWLFKEMENYPIDTCIMEVSSHALKLHRVDETAYDYAIFTNLTEDHLDFHSDMEDYYKTKKLLFQRAQKACLINIDDAYGKRLFEELKAEGHDCVYSYGIESATDFQAVNIQAWHDGSSFTYKTKQWTLTIDIPIPGKIYVYNVLAVLGVLELMNLDEAELMLAVKAIKPVSGRLEVVPNGIGATIVVDYAHTPDALQKVIDVCREFTAKKLFVIFGCGGDRDKFKRPVMGRYAVEGADYVVITNDNPRTEEPSAIIADILEGISEEDKEKYRIEMDRRKAIEWATQQLETGDTLIIAGKGHENYQIIGETKHHFDDREEAAKALLYKRGSSEAKHESI